MNKQVEAGHQRKAIPGVEAKIFTAMSTSQDVQQQKVTGLTPFTNYTLAIKAFNSGGEGPESDAINFNTLEDGENLIQR